VDPALWRKIYCLIKVLWNKEEIPINCKMLLYEKGVQNKRDKYRGTAPFICTYKSAANYTKQETESQCRKNNWLLPKGIKNK